MRSCVSGRDGKFWTISIRADGPMFAEMADREMLPTVFWKEYAAPPDADIDDRAAWKAANPGLGSIKSRSYMRDRVESVKLSPSDQPYFRAHDLNMQENPDREMVCTFADWKECEVVGRDRLPPRDGPCFVGFDLGGSESMTAHAAYWPGTGRLETKAYFPDFPNPRRRGKTDGVGDLYERMVERGELELHPGRVVNVVDALVDLADDLADCDVEGVAADSFRKAEAEQAFDDAAVAWDLEFRANMSGREGSHDIRAFQKAVTKATLRCAERLLLRSALKESDVKRHGENRHPSLGKARSRGRIDVLAAAIQAIGLAAAAPARSKASDFVLTELTD